MLFHPIVLIHNILERIKQREQFRIWFLQSEFILEGKVWKLNNWWESQWLVYGKYKHMNNKTMD